MNRKGSKQDKSWFSKNKLWVIPVSFVGAVAFVALILTLGSSLFDGITSRMKESPSYQESLVRAKSNKSVISLIGEPIEPYGLILGKVRTMNGVKSVNLTIPIKGPRGEAKILVIGGESDNSEQWTYTKMEVVVFEGSKVVSLIVPDV